MAGPAGCNEAAKVRFSFLTNHLVSAKTTKTQNLRIQVESMFNNSLETVLQQKLSSGTRGSRRRRCPHQSTCCARFELPLFETFLVHDCTIFSRCLDGEMFRLRKNEKQMINAKVPEEIREIIWLSNYLEYKWLRCTSTMIFRGSYQESQPYRFDKKFKFLFMHVKFFFQKSFFG